MKNGVYIGIGTEIAREIILEGEIYRGSLGASGEFSSMLDRIKNPDNDSASE